MSFSNAALLVMDVQQGVVQRFGGSSESLDPFQRAVGAARAAGVPVIFVRVAFRHGYPEVSPRNKRFSAISNREEMTRDDASTQVHPLIAPRPDEVVVTKLRVSAFSGSDLEVVLRAKQVETLVLTGIATSGVVLSTLREAADKDFRLVVLADACLDADAEVHRVLIEKVFPRQAEVMTVEAWAKSLKGRDERK